MGARDEPFRAFVDAYRSRLIGTAALIHLDAVAAPELVDAVLAQVYAAWPHLDDPYAFALKAVLEPARADAGRPRTVATSFDLVDVEPVDARPDEDIRSELAGLTHDERQLLVLATYARLPLADVATILDREPGDVVAQLRSASERLQEMPRRHQRRRLATELADAGRVPDRESTTDASRAGRTLIWRRRLRAVAVAMAVLVLTAFGIRQALPPPAPVAAGTPAASSSATPRPPCDTSEERCRVRLVAAWRGEMADVISSHLDPQGRYFTGSSYSYGDDPGAGLWAGGGALALDLYRVRTGATVVYLQIATSRQYALRCGQLTGRTCQTQRFMDGNRFNLTDPFDVAHGLEVQHRPEGTYVITVVARNTSRAGRELPVTRADLIDLVSDPRLRLPPR